MKNLLSRVINSRPYFRSKKLAASYLEKPNRLRQIAVRAENRSRKLMRGRIAEYKETIIAFCSLLKAYAKGEYREVPWNTLLLITASILYFLFPLDLLPDFIVALGLIDDAALLGWTLNSVRSDIDAFTQATSSSSPEPA